MPVSIDIGSRHIKVAVGSPRRDGVAVHTTHNIKIPQEVTMGAPSTQLAAITNLLRPIFMGDRQSKTKAEKNQPCNVTLPDDRFLVRNVTVPKGNAVEIKNMALQELVATYNVDPSSIVETMVVSTQEDGRLLVRAASADRNITEGYYNLVEDIKLVPTSLNYHSNALAKLLRAQPQINSTNVGGLSYMLLDCGMFACTCHVFSGGNHMQSRFLPVGFSDLYHHLSRRNPVGDTTDKTIVYTPTFVQASNEYKNMPSVVTNQIEQFINRIVEELKKFTRTMSLSGVSSGNLERIFLFGGNAKIDGFEHRLSSMTNIKSEVISTVSNVDLRPGCEGITYQLNAAAALLNT
jgi:Tfp pilus assembly PilM family ATPase